MALDRSLGEGFSTFLSLCGCSHPAAQGEGTGLLLTAASFLPRMMWAAGAVAAMSSITFPAISAMVSRSTDPDQQGECLGTHLMGGFIPAGAELVVEGWAGTAVPAVECHCSQQYCHSYL